MSQPSEVLYSTSSPLRQEVTGAQAQVFAMSNYTEAVIDTITAGNVSALGAIDNNSMFVYIHMPMIHRSLTGQPLEIVGNLSDVQGEYTIVKIPIVALDKRWAMIKE